MGKTIVLSGRLGDITGQPIEQISSVTVKAPVVQVGGTITTTQPKRVDFDSDGNFSLKVVDGVGWLYIEGDGWSDSIRFVAAAGMVNFWEAVINAMPQTTGMIDYLAALQRVDDAARIAVEAAQAELTKAVNNINSTVMWPKRALSSGEDLDLLTTPGLYYATSYSVAISLLHRPTDPTDAGNKANVEVKGISSGILEQTWTTISAPGKYAPILKRRKDGAGAWSTWELVNPQPKYLAVGDDVFAKPVGDWLIASYTVASQVVNRPPANSGSWAPALVEIKLGPSGKKVIRWSSLNASTSAQSIWQTQQDNNGTWAAWRRIDGWNAEISKKVETRIQDVSDSEHIRHRGVIRTMLKNRLDKTDYPLWGFTAPTGERLTIPTHEGSGNATHPSVLYFKDGWNGWEYWMAMTPYPDSIEGEEDPNIIVSHDGTTWQVPAGLTNPLDNQPGKPGPHNSDPHLVMHPDGRMILTWRMVDRPDGGRNRIFMRTTKDGVTWTPKEEIWKAKDAGSGESSFLSQSLIWTGSTWRLYGVSGDFSPQRIRYYETADTTPTVTSWGAPKDCYVKNDVLPEREWWHFEIVPVDGEYWAVGNDHKRERGGGNGALYILHSKDGDTFTASTIPVIATAGAHRNDIYKADLLIVPTDRPTPLIDIYYSAYDLANDDWWMWRTTAIYADPYEEISS